ncbi:MAG TPA: septal ring lytic transglycosylase RlpA family protein [Candidatus Polarisedimenticolia bacterium]|nr:septal ring lytic transglycosylase RlpA family protein [Candidatus Polarisedimenticolia bacterium]
MKVRVPIALAVASLLALSACATTRPTGGHPAPEVGIASYYSETLQGRRTASGEPYDKRALTAAHRTLPFGSRVRVTNLANGLSVVVRINDRGPHVKGRMIDLSYAAARELHFIDQGTTRVRLEALDHGPGVD